MALSFRACAWVGSGVRRAPAQQAQLTLPGPQQDCHRQGRPWTAQASETGSEAGELPETNSSRKGPGPSRWPWEAAATALAGSSRPPAPSSLCVPSPGDPDSLSPYLISSYVSPRRGLKGLPVLSHWEATADTAKAATHWGQRMWQ